MKTRNELRELAWGQLEQLDRPVVSVTVGAKQEEKQQVVVLVSELRDENKANEIIQQIENAKYQNATIKVSRDKYGFIMIRVYFQY